MALHQSAVLEVLETFKAADVEDRIRAAAATIYQALIEAELTAVIGAGPHERTEARVAQRNGHRARVLTSTAGDLEVQIPKLRVGSSSRRCWSGAGGLIRAVRGDDGGLPEPDPLVRTPVLRRGSPWRGVLDARCQAAGVPASCRGVGPST